MQELSSRFPLKGALFPPPSTPPGPHFFSKALEPERGLKSLALPASGEATLSPRRGQSLRPTPETVKPSMPILTMNMQNQGS